MTTDNIERRHKKGLNKEEMCRKVLETVRPNTDVEVKMENDGSYKVIAVTRRKA